MPKQKKNSQDEELYFDIISPDSFVVSEEEDTSSEKKTFQIPIRKEKFFNYPKKQIAEEVVDDDDSEYEEVVEEVIVEEPTEESTIKERSPRRKKQFLWFKKRESRQPKASKSKPTKKEKSTSKPRFKIRGLATAGSFKKKFFIIFGLAILILASTFIILTFVTNSATISINTQKGSIDYAGNLLIDTNITSANYAKNILPGRIVKTTQTVSETFNSTGKVNGGAKAKGKITVYNAYNTSPQILVQNTRFESPDGLIFRTDARVTVPGATLKNGEIVPSSVIVNVTASETGTAYNIAPVRFTIPGFKGTDRFTGFYGESKDKFAGGSDGESTVVSAVDLKNAEKTASDKLFTQLDNELKNQVQSHEKTFTDAIVKKVTKVDFGGTKVGDSTDRFTVNITGEISTIVFTKDDYLNVVKYNVEKSLEKDEELFGDFTERIIAIKPDNKNNTLSINTSIQYPTKKKLDGTEIISQIKGKSLEATKQLLANNPAIEKTNITLRPFWLTTIPDTTQKINLGID